MIIWLVRIAESMNRILYRGDIKGFGIIWEARASPKMGKLGEIGYLGPQTPKPGTQNVPYR